MYYHFEYHVFTPKNLLCAIVIRPRKFEISSVDFTLYIEVHVQVFCPCNNYSTGTNYKRDDGDPPQASSDETAISDVEIVPLV